MKVIGVRFQQTGKMYYFDSRDIELSIDDAVIVDTEQGIDIAYVVQTRLHLEEQLQVQMSIAPIVRKATHEDIQKVQEYSQREKEAMKLCQEKIEQHQLDMNLVHSEYAFDGNKLTFYFTSDGRVDFRELVKDLAGIFRVRIELRQIGVRDEARLIGGLGACGREVCCKAFLDEFRPVSIKMAKEQNLSLNPIKISGICGRLMCCLQYEQDCYVQTRKKMPRIGAMVKTPDGKGVVISNYILTENVRVRMHLKDDTYELRDYQLKDVQVLKEAMVNQLEEKRKS